MKQIRAAQQTVIEVVYGILKRSETFEEALENYGEFQGQELDE